LQPKTNITFDEKTFNRLKKTVSAIARAERKRKESVTYASKIPIDIGVELTNRCNLRCKHCFLWNHEGLYEKTQEELKPIDLDLDIMGKILHDSEPEKSNLFFWGTEPLLYKYWDDLTKILEKDVRWTVVCTNGMLIDRKIDSLLRISENLATVISVDGFEEEHDHMRGKGRFKKLLENISLLSDLHKKGIYKGKITLHCVLNEKLIPRLYEFCKFAESTGIDSLYIGYPWYIAPLSADRMDAFVESKLQFLSVNSDKLKSWHTYSYHLNPESIDQLKEQAAKITAHAWKVRFRFQPAVEINEIEDYVTGVEKPVQKRKNCYAISNRMDIRANGTVTACQCFPELVVGSLHHQSPLDIWHGEHFNRVRAVVSRGLMPVCSRCILLYLNGK